VHDASPKNPSPLHHHSVTGKQWQLRTEDERAVLSLMQRFQLSEILARILVGRGITLETAEDFLTPTLRNLLPDPLHLLDMEKGASRIADAVMGAEKIVIFGDYDVDGATSSALLKNFLEMLGCTAGIYIPDRITEGYGPNSEALLALHEQGTKLVITVDCGTVSFEPLEAAAACGLEVIVVDHHLGTSALPKAVAVINPNRLDETSEHRHLAAVGVCFLLAVAVTKILRERGGFTERKEPNLMSLLDLVALGTVCDVVPLKGVNRAFVTQGLKILASRKNIGLSALNDIAGLNELPNCYHLGFVLGPRINAGGRVGQADLGARLLSGTDYDTAKAIALRLDGFNQERKAIETLVLEEAMRKAEAVPSDAAALIIAGEGWHPGVIGIVASRLKERYHKPTAVIALSDGIGKASARSVSGIDFGSAVVSARSMELLIAGGGHAMAAGFTVEEEKIPALSDFLCSRFNEDMARLAQSQTYKFDSYLSIPAVSAELLQLLEQAGPFGTGNPSPRFVLASCFIGKVDILGEAHIRCFVGSAASGNRGGSLKAMMFNGVGTPVGDALLASAGKALHLAGSLRLNKWQGNETAEFMIEDVAF
jgi:single-stranded-DNA-specific exonuclease